MPTPDAPSTPEHTGKLGLALAGGGFRASLFHLGVLRRLAELDLLRRVEVLSTVSGGSIVGILYVLLLKKHLERPGGAALTREQYLAIIDELDAILGDGVRRNLRTRLLMNPFGVLLALLTGDTLSRRMGRIYERYLLEPIVRHFRPDRPWWQRLFTPGRMELRELVIRPGGERITGGLDDYNARQRAAGGSVVTNIIINATTLNSGGRFFFTAVELGDWYLGTFRADELKDLLARKHLLQRLGDEELDAEIVRRAASGGEDADRAHRAATLARWWRQRRLGEPAETPAGWERLFAIPGFPGDLEAIPLGRLRRIKVAAWYLLDGPRREVTGGRSAAEHWARVAGETRDAAPLMGEALLDAAGDAALRPLVLELLLELYLLRSAEAVSWRVEDDWRRLRVGHAMGASACFPPVFPPFLVYGIYDDLHVARLGLTDGGVYDNVGVTALLDEGCSGIIASDTGGAFETLPHAPTGHVGLALRVPAILMRALGGTQRESLRERLRVSRAVSGMLPPPPPPWSDAQTTLDAFRATRRLDHLAYFHIAYPRVAVPDGTAPPIELPFSPTAVAALRTDLDGFAEGEVAALINHGYDMTDRYARRYLATLGDASRWASPRAPRPMPSAERLEAILHAGHARFFRALALRAPVSWAVTIGLVAALPWAMSRAGVTIGGAMQWTAGVVIGGVRAIVDGVAAAVAWVVHTIVPWVPARLDPPLTERPGVLMALAAIAGLAFLASKVGRPRDTLRTGRRARATRVLIRIRTWVRAYGANVLWLAYGLPALIAAASTLGSLLSYLCYHLPFMHAARVREAERAGHGVSSGRGGHASSPMADRRPAPR